MLLIDNGRKLYGKDQIKDVIFPMKPILLDDLNTGSIRLNERDGLSIDSKSNSRLVRLKIYLNEIPVITHIWNDQKQTKQ